MKSENKFIVALTGMIFLLILCMYNNYQFYILEQNIQTKSEEIVELNSKLQEVDVLQEELNTANETISELKESEYKLVYMGEYKYTYYCNESRKHICGSGTGLTASGKPTQVGWTVAADWSVLPNGSIIYIEGVGYREVMDNGSAVNGNHIDILVNTHSEALSQGTTGGGVWLLAKNS